MNELRRIVLSKRDTARLIVLLENPPRPTVALLAAVRRRGSRVDFRNEFSQNSGKDFDQDRN